ncbi:class I SAM-dependent methyltransferase [Streptomyces capitiformicae]|uniref:Methyltransferase type 11 domain-containing protein n=1 Tax=Streptomyces capitiformicae TaxID=2014920 RepID=A0A919DKW0_9ACTN|nr:class I SAM-dependent methyltransferase [Streptomyces capitiformicae]GHE52763.1 hypothetical protein GCM10017771_75070 [Streptomyces capitiformicae]
MALTTLDRIEQLLVCPCCQSPLASGPDGFRCTSDTCRYHAADSFPFFGKWPLLVDTERSIVGGDGLVPSDSPAGSQRHGTPRRPAADRLPAVLRPLWKPRNRAAARNVERLFRLLDGSAPTLLVVGGGTVGNGVEAIYADPRVQVIGFDIVTSPATQFVADAHQIPLAGRTVDAVVVQAVLEHVLDPRQVVAEIHRVLKDDGIVYAETPFLQQVHAGAYDFVRYTASGHRYLFRRFEEIDAGTVAGPGTALLWSLDHVVRGLTRSALAGRLLRGLLSWLHYLDLVIPPGYAQDNASAFYFLGRKRAHGMSAADIVAYYSGAQSMD